VADSGVQLNLFGPDDWVAMSGKAGAPTIATRIASSEAFAALLRAIENAELVAFDTETTGVDMTRCDLVGISVCVAAGSGSYVPVDADLAEGWSLQRGSPEWRELGQVLNRAPGMLAAHNAKYDLGVLKRAGMPIERIVYDTMIAQFLVEPLRHGGYGLKALAREYFGWDMIEIGDLIGHSRQQLSMRDVPIDLATPYACADADATFRLVGVMQPRVSELKLGRLLNEVELPLVPVLVDMELCGVAIDTAHMGALSQEMTARLRALEADIFKLAGRVFNVGSPQQLSNVLYKALGLPVRVRDDDDSSPSTRAYTLENLREQHAIVPLVLEHRELSKLLGTYADALPAMMNPLTGRLHTTFNQAVVVTGRLSSSNPNLQNIPITSELGRRVRRGFVAQPGGVILSADYSQVELRLLAHLAGDPVLRGCFERDEDVHASTAAAVYNVPLEAVTPEQRTFAKRINFGICYGMGAYSLAQSTGMSEQQAQQFIGQYFRRFSRVKAWLDGTRRKMARDHYVDTLYGRRRNFPDVSTLPSAEVRRQERLAINHPVQGTAADVIKLAMIRLHRELRAGGYRSLLTLQVHDELVIDVAPGETGAVIELVRREMERALPLSVPLKAEIGTGPNWNDVA
jgi:DNA polymerase I